MLNVQEKTHSLVYVPILELLSKLFEITEILQSLQTSTGRREGHYSSFQDGEYFKENKPGL